MKKSSSARSASRSRSIFALEILYFVQKTTRCFNTATTFGQILFVLENKRLYEYDSFFK